MYRNSLIELFIIKHNHTEQKLLFSISNKLNMKEALILFIVLFIANTNLLAQNENQYKTIADIETTRVKSQGRTGTCWAFSTISFIESEIIRMGGPTLNLSEMYIVRYAYLNKAKQYVYKHGMGNFSQGGQAHDVLKVIAQHGFVPESYYLGRENKNITHNHKELELVLKTMLDAYIEQKNAQPKKQWFDNINAILESELGATPRSVKFNNRKYSPLKFSDALGVKPDSYVELSSYSHHPYYKQFILEVPDNWSNDLYYNIKLDELIDTMKEALKQGYTFVWDGDVSEDFFSHKNSLAILPEVDSLGFVPQAEIQVTTEERQESFFNWKATDDHLMHVTGLVQDENGTIYFKTKNSWGKDSNDQGGYLYMSEAYMRMNTVAIMLHKDAINKELSKKLFDRY